jgi:hypothetical protein
VLTEENKSFLVLFFKKELLPCYADVLISTQVGIRARFKSRSGERAGVVL